MDPHSSVSARLLEPGGIDSSAAASQEVQPIRTPASIRAACRVREVDELIIEALRTWNEVDEDTKWEALDRIIATFKTRMPLVYLGALADELWQAARPNTDNHWDSDWSINS